MRTSISRLRPRHGDYDAAIARYRAAAVASCLSELHGLDDDRSVLLRARALLRGGDPSEAMRALEGVRGSGHAVSGERELLRGVAAGRLADPARAADALACARAYAIGSGSVAMQAEVDYYDALGALGRGAFAPAETLAQTVVRTRPPADDAYPVPLAHTVARAFEILESLEARAGRFEGTFTRLALERLDGSPLDAWVTSTAMMNHAGIAQDLDQQEVAMDISERYASFPWNEALAQRRCTVAISLGWCAALRGDEIAAFRWFRDAAGASHSPVARLDVAVDRGRLAAELHQTLIAVEEIDYAVSLARTIDWTVAGERREVLVGLAAAAAPSHATDARWALDRYRAVNGAASPSFAAGDQRVRVAIALAEGRIARSEGRLHAAISYFLDAFGVARAIGFAWRAHDAAVELAELGAGDAFARFARDEARKRPASWLGRRTAALNA